MPKRIQRKRTKGWKMPANTVYVGRPSLWGNQWFIAPQVRCGCRHAGCDHQSIFRVNDAKEAVDIYRAWRWVMQRNDPAKHADFIAPLRGKNLACWCPLDQPCHADVLLELANQ